MFLVSIVVVRIIYYNCVITLEINHHKSVTLNSHKRGLREMIELAAMI